jgi:hypothetical protein
MLVRIELTTFRLSRSWVLSFFIHVFNRLLFLARTKARSGIRQQEPLSIQVHTYVPKPPTSRIG